MQREALIERLEAAVEQAFGESCAAPVALERPRNPEHGDWATNIALQLAKSQGRPPRDIATAIVQALQKQEVAGIEKVEIAGPGFINIRLDRAARFAAVRAALEQGEHYGRGTALAGQNIMVEFVSANPTGPLHTGHARQAALGDTLCNLLEAQGAHVHREFYYNDAGNQIEQLARSVQLRARGIGPEHPDWPEDGYRGEYVVEIARDYLAQGGDLDDLEAVRRFAVERLRAEQDRDLQAFGVRPFDCYYLESSLYTDGRVERVVDALQASGYTYEAEGALWLKTTVFGDDKDRVMRKANGGYTYFVPDVAYHVTKWERGFRRVINIQGTDHHGTIARVRAGLQALGLGIPADYPSYLLHSMVRVVRGGQEVKVSKRAGSYVTLGDLIQWVGKDAARFFLVSRKADSEFVFDLDLAVAESEDNPVYYVQYAHARICSVLREAELAPAALQSAALTLLVHEKAQALAAKIADYPILLATAARELAPHLLPFYLRELAAAFHAYYVAERVRVEDPALRAARAALCAATAQVLKNGLALMGVSAPERM
ncbi:MAG: arginine--tRNA ligase [Casimicrobiaceae bacterium]|nr:arginine--tRNA ligase [Casimicrobiaceae bacterium]MDW8311907.1 arginine--tRNA ligase [Burkholderiales bacterium]